MVYMNIEQNLGKAAKMFAIHLVQGLGNDRTLKAAKMLAMQAVMRADHAKSSSLTDAKTTPPITCQGE
jgi:hypothetical protein